MVVGGAHSVDKMRCIEENKPFFADEMPNDVIKARVENRLAAENNSIYGMMTHTCPIDYLPTEMFMSTKQNAEIKRKPKKQNPKNYSSPILTVQLRNGSAGLKRAWITKYGTADTTILINRLIKSI